ncbi:MAG: hypothetical protein R3Y65_01890 [Bacillota bacterium]
MAEKISCRFFENLECRNAESKKDCGGYLYNCPDLKCKKEIYQSAIKKVLQYDFNQIELLPLSCYKYYKDREKKYYENREEESCKGKRDRITEPYLCRCQYYQAVRGCDKACNEKWHSKEYGIIDYQLPTAHNHTAANVDLVLKRKCSNDSFLIEYKPEKSEERLLRMIAEIVSYSIPVKKGDRYLKFLKSEFDITASTENIHLGIMFHEDSPQHEEYKEGDKGIIQLFEKYNINIFMITKNNEIILLKAF